MAFATTDKTLGPAGIAGFVIDKGNPGMRQGRKERKLGVRASHTAQVIFENCFVADDARLGFDAEGNAAGASAEVLAELAGLLADGRLELPVAKVYPLSEVRAAYEELESRHTRGKIVLRP